MSRSISRNGQGAIEFTIMLSLVMFLFLGLFIYLSNEFGAIDRAATTSRSIASGVEILDQIELASRSSIGFTKQLEFRALDVETGSQVRFISDRTGRVREVVLTELSGNEHIMFLDQRTVFYQDACDGRNELLRTADGVGLCCGSCNGRLPIQQPGIQIECAAPGSLPLFYRSCAEFKQESDFIAAMRVNCSAQGLASFSYRITNDTGTFIMPAMMTNQVISGTGYYVLGNFSPITGGGPEEYFHPCFRGSHLVEIRAQCFVPQEGGVYIPYGPEKTTNQWQLTCNP